MGRPAAGSELISALPPSAIGGGLHDAFGHAMANVSDESHRGFVKFLRRFFSSVLAVEHSLCESHAIGDASRVLFAAAGVPLQGALKQYLPA
jgi:hypothetical protein